jgi:hypothetical protein
VLAEVDAKRCIVKRYEDQRLVYDARMGGILTKHLMQDLYETVRLLALPYRDHPAYREGWATEAS